MDKFATRIVVFAALALVATLAFPWRQAQGQAGNQTVVTMPYTQVNLRSDSVDSTIRRMSQNGWRFVAGVPNEEFNQMAQSTRVITLVFQR